MQINAKPKYAPPCLGRMGLAARSHVGSAAPSAVRKASLGYHMKWRKFISFVGRWGGRVAALAWTQDV